MRIYVRIKHGAVLEPVRNIQSKRCLKAEDKIFCFQDPPDQTIGDSHTHARATENYKASCNRVKQPNNQLKTDNLAST